MRVPSVVVREIVERLLKGEDYRPAIINLKDIYCGYNFRYNEA